MDRVASPLAASNDPLRTKSSAYPIPHTRRSEVAQPLLAVSASTHPNHVPKHSRPHRRHSNPRRSSPPPPNKSHPQSTGYPRQTPSAKPDQSAPLCNPPLAIRGQTLQSIPATPGHLRSWPHECECSFRTPFADRRVYLKKLRSDLRCIFQIGKMAPYHYHNAPLIKSN